MNFLEALPASLANRLNQLKTVLAAHTKRAYLVGGCVRDILLGIEVKDIDIEVYDISPEAFSKLMDQIGAVGVGKSFFVYKWHKIDIALARKENKVSTGHRGFEVTVCQDEKVASMRRDFTCNALMVGLFDGKVLDFWGGIEDLKALRLRHIDDKMFGEDSLRVLRAVQFSARFGFKISKKTLEIMKKLDLKELSQTRITWELQKLFLGEYYTNGVFALCKLNLFESVLHVKLSPNQARHLAKMLHKYKKNVPKNLKPYYWLFCFFSVTKIDPKPFLAHLGLGREYERVFVNVPLGNPNMSDFELLKVAMDRPLKSWIGICYDGFAKRAKELGVYEKPFDGGVDVQAVIQDGFKNKEIGIEYKRRILEAAKKRVDS